MAFTASRLKYYQCMTQRLGYNVKLVPWPTESEECESVTPATFDQSAPASDQTPLVVNVSVSLADLITPVHAAERLGVSRERIQQLRGAGRLQTVLVDDVPFVLKAEVEARKTARA